MTLGVVCPGINETVTSRSTLKQGFHNIERLSELAHNLWWSWNPQGRELFEQLDPQMWEECRHNPVELLGRTKHLAAASQDGDFVEAYRQALYAFDSYLESHETWFSQACNGFMGQIAYFSAEFGLHESLPIYSGGLGILAGDHVKSASDLGVPLVGVGILYSQGYFCQRLNAQGWQEEIYEPFVSEKRPLQPATDQNGNKVQVQISLPGRILSLKVWKVAVGRAPVLLLDADLPENSAQDRGLTAQLYGGDHKTRISQELILGVGGLRALRAAGFTPSVFHMNEGHAAFMGLERMRELVLEGRSFEQAREQVAQRAVFTTHTPVPAGHDAFGP